MKCSETPERRGGLTADAAALPASSQQGHLSTMPAQGWETCPPPSETSVSTKSLLILRTHRCAEREGKINHRSSCSRIYSSWLPSLTQCIALPTAVHGFCPHSAYMFSMLCDNLILKDVGREQATYLHYQGLAERWLNGTPIW